MNDFKGLLSSDYGFKPQGKSAPMAPPKPTNSNANSPFNFDIGGTKTTSSNSSFLDDHDTLLRPNRKPQNFSDLGGFDNVFGSKSSNSSVNLDSIFGGGSGSGGNSAPKFSSLPVFDQPLYDDDVFDGGPGSSGLKSSSSAKYEDMFSSSSKKSDAFDDILGGLGRKKPQSARSGSPGGPASKEGQKGVPSFDDLLPGFGGGSSVSSNRTSSAATKKSSSGMDDPFVVLESTSPPAPSSSGIFTDPLEDIGNPKNSGRKTVENSGSGGVFDDIDPLGSHAKSVPAFSAEMNGGVKDASPLRTGPRVAGRPTSADGDIREESSVRSSERASEKTMPMEDYQEYAQSVFDMPSVSAESHGSVSKASSPAYDKTSFRESNSQGHVSTASDENVGSGDDVWLSVSEIPLFTQPTAAPPPSRPPPPRPARFSRAESGSFPASNEQKKFTEYSSFGGSGQYFQSPKSAPAEARGAFTSPIDELEHFAMGRNLGDAGGTSDVHSGEEFDTHSAAAASAAAMKEAMDRAEAKFKHARGVRERENAKAFRSKEAGLLEKEEKADQDEREIREKQERLEHERQQREREEEEKRRREEEERRCYKKEQEEKEREKRRVERERELTRQAVERSAREARERAAAEARVRAERAVVQKAQAEARERAGRAAVQRVQAEARERAAAAASEAKERAEKASEEAREKAKAEAREKEARERAAAAARANQPRNENDLESFFSMGSRASSVPRPRASSSGPFEAQFHSKPASEATRTSVNSSTSMSKASSSTNIVDDLSSIFGGPTSSGEFQEVEGESEDRRRARLERHQRTQERATKALAEKNARDLEAQREQAERHRIAETLDVEIKRWAAGKEGNLRALLSTMQYVLWPECGWQPVSLTDLITAVAVKKVYRKATLCIHPDKVQQKGATLQQKYVSEKVFDLLKEAWNKFNSEELF